MREESAIRDSAHFSFVSPCPFCSDFSKVFAPPHCGHFWGLHRPSFSKPHWLHWKTPISSTSLIRKRKNPAYGFMGPWGTGLPGKSRASSDAALYSLR